MPNHSCAYCGAENAAHDVVFYRRMSNGTYQPTTRHACDNCAPHRSRACGECERVVENGQLYSMHPNRVICRACAQNRASCHRCGTYLQDADRREVQFQTYCPTCHDHLRQIAPVCVECGESAFQRTAIANPSRTRQCVCNDCWTRNREWLLDSTAGRTFGVEIEFLSPESVRKWDAWRWGSIHGDGSVRPQSDDPAPADPYEFASHPLRGVNGAVAVREVCAMLQSKGAFTNWTCGTHIHIGASDLNRAQLECVKAWWLTYERLFFAAVAPARRRNGYCMPSLKNDPDYGTWSQSRYRALNLLALGEHGTLEFRLHHGTVDADAILNFTRVAMAFVSRCKDSRPSAAHATLSRRALCADFFNTLQLPLSLRKYFLRQIRANNRRATLLRETRKAMRYEKRGAA